MSPQSPPERGSGPTESEKDQAMLKLQLMGFKVIGSELRVRVRVRLRLRPRLRVRDLSLLSFPSSFPSSSFS